MTQSRRKIQQRLTTAWQQQGPVTVRRKQLDADRTDGYVLAITDEWVVLQDFVEAVCLDSVVLLRLDHVTKVERHDNEAYVKRAVAGLKVPRAEFVCPVDAPIGDLLRLIDRRAKLVCVYVETRDDYSVLVGRILRIGGKRLHLHFIGRDGVWSDFTESWNLKAITRIEYGGRYLKALEQFGEQMPAVTKHRKR